jgi:hypothetical protein
VPPAARVAIYAYKVPATQAPKGGKSQERLPPMSKIDFAPRALLHRRFIHVRLTAFELHELVRVLEERARRYLHDPETNDVAQHWLDRVAELREVIR